VKEVVSVFVRFVRPASVGMFFMEELGRKRSSDGGRREQEANLLSFKRGAPHGFQGQENRETAIYAPAKQRQT
jgi:hypothetical protein